MTRAGSQDSATIESLKGRISRDPLSRAFLQLAEEYRRLGRYQDAVQVCLDGLARHPTYHTARISLGRTYMEAGNLEAAGRALSEVLELAPENHLAGKLLAEVQRKIGDLTGAAETYRAILRYYPADREVAALLQDLQKVRPTAPKVLEPTLEYRSEDLPVAAPKGDRRPAVTTAAPVRETKPQAAPEEARPPEDGDAMQTNTLAELYLRQGLVDRAVEVYRAMLRVDPGNAKARRRLQELAPESVAAPAPPPTTPSETQGIDRLERWLRSIKAGRGPEASPR
jgi:tetratricopeptide (TPR) repeat protein